MKCTQRLYLTKDRKKAVGEGHKDAVTLYAVPGDEFPQSAVEMFGLVDGHLKGFDPEKEGRGGRDKEDRGGSDKGGGDKSEPHELTKLKGIGAATAKALVAAGIGSIAALAEVDPANPPKVDGLPAAFDFKAVVAVAKERAGASAGAQG